MSGPPIPPRPYEWLPYTQTQGIPPPPPLPPLPATVRAQNELYSRPSPYEAEEAPPQYPVSTVQMMAPRPHRVDPAPTVQTLNDLASKSLGLSDPFPQQPAVSIPVPVIPTAPPPPPAPPTATAAAPAAGPQMPGLPSLTAPLPALGQLIAAAPIIQQPAHEPSLKVAWCRDVFTLIDRSTQPSTSSPSSTDPPVGPVSISDPSLARLAQIAIPIVLQLASSYPTPPQGPKVPYYVAEAISMRATLAATGAFPEHVRHNPRAAFRDFESAARNGFAIAWFRLGRDYENFNDHSHARECFERGVKLNIESCLYRLGMAHLLGQLSVPQNPAQALPLLHRAATLATLSCPQPAYVYALLLLSEFTQLAPLPPSMFAPYIPVNSSPHLEARKHLERAAFLHFAPAQYKLGHAYEFAEPPFPFDPLLSVQYYSLASQQGEVEADMALSKWFLCGSGGVAAAGGPNGTSGGFEKDEPLALLFAEKAANRGLPSAQFAMAYYAEVGVGQARSLDSAIHWYTLAAQQGNADAIDRLRVLDGGGGGGGGPQGGGGLMLTREDHEDLAKVNVERKRTIARERMETEVVSPPWEGKSFPKWNEQQQELQQQQDQQPAHGKKVVDLIRKASLAANDSQQLHSQRRQGPRYPWGDNVPGPKAPVPGQAISAPPSTSTSPKPYSPPKQQQQQYQIPPSAYGPPGGRNPSPSSGVVRPSSSASAAKLRITLEDRPSSSSGGSGSKSQSFANLGLQSPSSYGSGTHSGIPSPVSATGGKNKPQTFAEMGFHGAKVEEKDCVVM